MEFSGDFETHVTVQPCDGHRLAELRDWSVQRGIKFLHIVLDQGSTPSQPMISLAGKGTLAAQLAEAEQICGDLRIAGFPAARIKVEAAPWNQGVPQSDAAAPWDDNQYFEHHIKLLLEAEQDLASVVQVLAPHTAHLSKNALRKRDDGRQERFVTQRCFRVGRSSAQQRLNALLREINVLKLPVLEVEEEFVVYDSNLDVDAGWISAKEAV